MGLLLNVTAGAIDPTKVPAILHWGWFGLALYFPIYVIYVSPAWGYLVDSWRLTNARRKTLQVLLYVGVIAAYCWLANVGVITAWKKLRPPPPTPAGVYKPESGLASGPKATVIVEPRHLSFDAALPKETYSVYARQADSSDAYSVEIKMKLSQPSSTDFSFGLPHAKPIIPGSLLADVQGLRCVDTSHRAVVMFWIYHLEPGEQREITVTHKATSVATLDSTVSYFSTTPPPRRGDPLKSTGTFHFDEKLDCNGDVTFEIPQHTNAPVPPLGKKEPVEPLRFEGASCWEAAKEPPKPKTNFVLPSLSPSDPLFTLDKEPTLVDLLDKDFKTGFFEYDDCTLVAPDEERIPLRMRIFTDFPEKSIFFGLYISSGNNEAWALRRLAEHIKPIISGFTSRTGGLGGDLSGMNTLKDLVFTGRVFIYHQVPLTTTEKADIVKTYQANEIDVYFRGLEWLVARASQWRAHRSTEGGGVEPHP